MATAAAPAGPARTIRLHLPARHPGQAQAVAEARRFNVVACGRRWGKTTLGIERAARTALDGRPAGWFAPTYKQLADVWRTVTDALEPVTTRRSEQEKRLELLTGGVLDCWSLDEPDTARGRAYARVVVDEAASVRGLEAAWQQVLRPTLTDHQGDAWFLSTPKGLNFFWHLYQRGADPLATAWAAWSFPTSSNPHLPPEEVAAARRELPERVFAQEYLAAFLEDGGGVFRGVLAAATGQEDAEVREGHAYVIGVDWAKWEDYTVFCVVDATDRRQVFQDRFNQIDYPLQLERLTRLWQHYRAALVVAERNAMGDPLLDQLAREGLPVWPFTTTNATKGAAVEELALAFERQELTILAEPTLLGELQAYQAQRLPSGLLRYGAPEGQHDDTVMALALAWQGARSAAERPTALGYGWEAPAAAPAKPALFGKGVDPRTNPVDPRRSGIAWRPGSGERAVDAYRRLVQQARERAAATASGEAGR